MILHGGHPHFREIAPRIADAVGGDAGGLPVATLGAVRELPDRYAFYNTESLHAPHKLDKLRGVLDGAERVFDYSEVNLEVYPRAEFRPPTLGEVRSPPTRSPSSGALFCGCLTPRRGALTSQLHARVIDGVYGDEMLEEVRRARLYLSVNAFDSRNGSPFRTFPALEMGARVVCEETEEAWFNDTVRPHVAALVPYGEIVDVCRRLLRGST